ncbi:LPS-assembly protein LptD precursor [Methyloligella halotolerans]|uniref:LPS-assembly protein LptD n=1 Tax=Methyloligella halotolerans TaxID=1177755 RepID=A0A1E2S258_9HYPH|nr:LPS-assembly protein LptD [Methyloligella halotolerans]ODA68429.1 LPS-assembly protein LptD precursor [Methyloligella halotolerans]
MMAFVTSMPRFARRALPGLAASKGEIFSRAQRGSARLLSALVLGILVGSCFAFPRAAMAQNEDNLNNIVSPPKIDENAPMLLQADEMVYDNDSNKVTAKGSVEIYYGNYTLLADRVVYDRSANTLSAEGNVRIKDPDGAVISSNQMTLTDDFRDGFIDALKVVTQDDTRIVANTAQRQAGNVTEFQQGWFTPCKPCKDNPDKAPTWRIRAKEITHNKEDATITFRDAAFDLFGVPIAYTPYLQTADPTVKRKTGFLMPVYTHSNDLGNTLTTPYYFALSDHYDFTFSPMFTTKQNVLLRGDWRHRLANGSYHVELAGVYDNGDPDSPANTDFRGSIKTAGRFALNPYWSWGWDILAESDDTFRRFYQLDSYLKTDRVSQVYLEGLHDRNYMSMRAYYTDGLIYYDDDESKSRVHPIIDYDYIVDQPILGGELSFNSNVMSLSRVDAEDSNRVIMEADWRREMIDGMGQVYTPFARLRGDAYGISDYPQGDESSLVRGNAVAGAEYKYPFVANTGSVTHIMEPVAQLIARPNSVGDQENVPNEDANSLVFDDTILFEIDKFSGYDRIETGTRANVGVRYTAQLFSGAYMRTVFGQSYQLAGDSPFAEGTGLYNDTSDYVAGAYIQANDYLGFSAQSRFAEDDLDIRRTDLGANADYGPISVSVNYADVPHDNDFYVEDREEVRTRGALAVTDNWALLGQLRYDLVDDLTLQDGIGLRYQDDCFTFALTYLRSNFEDRDIDPDKRIMAQFSFKYLGDYELKTDASTFDSEN